MKSEVQIVDDALSEEHYNMMKNTMWTDQFPWYMDDGYAGNTPEQKALGFKFIHVFFNGFFQQSSYFSMLGPLFNILQPLAFIRIQAVMTPRGSEISETGWHVDMPNCLTAIYYLNTTNGHLKFKGVEEPVEAKANRLVLFDSNIEHCGTKATDNDRRTLINFNYFKSEVQELDFIDLLKNNMRL